MLTPYLLYCKLHNQPNSLAEFIKWLIEIYYISGKPKAIKRKNVDKLPANKPKKLIIAKNGNMARLSSVETCASSLSPGCPITPASSGHCSGSPASVNWHDDYSYAPPTDRSNGGSVFDSPMSSPFDRQAASPFSDHSVGSSSYGYSMYPNNYSYTSQMDYYTSPEQQYNNQQFLANPCNQVVMPPQLESSEFSIPLTSVGLEELDSLELDHNLFQEGMVTPAHAQIDWSIIGPLEDNVDFTL